MPKNLLIVESPGKVQKISSYLGADWRVEASVGHIRELKRDGSDGLGFDLGDDRIECRYQPRNDKAKEKIAKLKSAAERVQQIYLATDPDREGESISWHLAEVLGLKNPQRVVFNEITKKAIESAVATPRPLDRDLVDAARYRACIDKLVGYKISPLVWRLNNGAKSVGRVQSAALHILVAREREIAAFVPVAYHSVWVDYGGWKAFYDRGEVEVEDEGESTRISDRAEAERLVGIAKSSPHGIVSVDSTPELKQPPPPFTTSMLQQVASSKLKLSPDQTMALAQQLYEAGHITYMRSDSVSLSDDFKAAAKQWLESHDPDNIPDRDIARNNADGAQAAHEAIRPTDINKTELAGNDDAAKLYRLIWERAIASLCRPARLQKTTIVTQSGEVRWLAKGRVLEFAGYTRYWQDLAADSQLPLFAVGESLTPEEVGNDTKKTQAPARYTEAKLVSAMEKSGIGRPSTYAPTIATLKQIYVRLEKNKLVPTDTGVAVDEFLMRAIPDLLDPEFTADIEATLDRIANGDVKWERHLIDWHRDYFSPLLARASEGLPPATPRGNRESERSDVRCPSCDRQLLKVTSQKSAVGHFLKCEVCKSEDKNLVMFWNERGNRWEQPRLPQAGVKVAHPCPTCKGSLERYDYRKEGEAKSMLRCSNSQHRAKQCKDVAFFMSKNNQWWSKQHGTLD